MPAKGQKRKPSNASDSDSWQGNEDPSTEISITYFDGVSETRRALSPADMKLSELSQLVSQQFTMVERNGPHLAPAPKHILWVGGNMMLPQAWTLTKLRDFGIAKVSAYITAENKQVEEYESRVAPINRMVIVLVFPWKRQLIITSPAKSVNEVLSAIKDIEVERWVCHNRAVWGGRFAEHEIGHGDELVAEIHPKVTQN